MSATRAARLDFDLLLITPQAPPSVLLQAARRALCVPEPRRVAIQLRAHALPAVEREHLARELRAITREAGAPLFVSAELELCRAVGADGVQLPERGPSVLDARQALGAHAWVGASRHDRAGLVNAARDGASFATLSPVLATPDKGAPLGVAGFLAAIEGVALPVLALGGVHADVTPALIRGGAAGVAVIRAGLGAPDPAESVRALLAAIDAARVADSYASAHTRAHTRSLLLRVARSAHHGGSGSPLRARAGERSA